MSALLGWIRVGLRDMRGDLSRFGVLIACLALGTSVIAAVGSVGANLRHAVERDAVLLLGGDVEVTRPDRAASVEEQALFDSLGNVAYVIETSARAVANDETALLDLVAVGGGYPLRGAVQSPDFDGSTGLATALAAQDGAFGAVVDPVLFDRLGLGVGDQFQVGATTLTVRGRLGQLPDGAARGFSLGVTVLISTEAMAQMSDLRPPLPGLLSNHRYKILLADVAEADAVAQLKSALDGDWSVRTPREAAGSLARYYDLFIRFLVIVGLSSLLVGGVGIVNGVSAYIGDRIRSIATLRSLGATGPRILVHFLTQVGLLTLVGVLLGLIAGAAATFFLLPVIGDALGINLTPSIEVVPLLTAAAFGLLLGFAFSYLPLVRAQYVSPTLLFRTLDASVPALGAKGMLAPATWLPLLVAAFAVLGLAVATTGDAELVGMYAAGAIAAFGFTVVMGRLLQAVLRRLPESRSKGLRHALRNIYRPGSSALVIVVSIGLGLAVLFVIGLVQINLGNQLVGAVSRDAPTFVVTDLFSDEVQDIQDLAASDPAFAGVDASPMLRGAIVGINGQEPQLGPGTSEEAAFLFSGEIPMTWRDTLPPNSTIVEGEWWAPDYDGPPLVSLRSSLQQALGLKVGDTLQVRLFSEVFDAEIANFRDYDWQNGINFIITFSPGLVSGFPSTYLGGIKANEGMEKDAERALVRAFPQVSFIPIGDVLAEIASLLDQLGSAVAAVGGIAVVNGVVVLAGTLAAGRKQRESDAVVHKVLGATRGDVLKQFVFEHALLGSLAALCAVVIGVSAAAAITWMSFEMAFSPDVGFIASVALGAVALTTLLGASMTWRAMSRRPVQYLRTA